MAEVIINYTLQGSIIAPEGTTLNDGAEGTAIILPDGRTLKLWEQFELIPSEDSDDYQNLTFDEVMELGIHYDGDMARLELAE